jgi:hypothetical protein
MKNNSHPADPGPLPEFKPTECVHCHEKFPTMSRIPIIGEPASAGFERFCANLIKHLTTKHPEQAQSAMLEAASVYQGLCGWLALKNFQSYDPEMIRQMDQTRHYLHAKTRMVKVTDQRITQKVDEIAGFTNMAMAAEHREAVVQLLKDFRDVYEERGLHPLTQDGPKLVV